VREGVGKIDERTGSKGGKAPAQNYERKKEKSSGSKKGQRTAKKGRRID